MTATIPSWLAHAIRDAKGSPSHLANTLVEHANTFEPIHQHLPMASDGSVSYYEVAEDLLDRFDGPPDDEVFS